MNWKRPIGRVVQAAIRRFGYELQAVSTPSRNYPADLDSGFEEVWSRLPPTIRGVNIRLFTTYVAVRHIIRARIEGDFVECGVYQGRQALMMAHTLTALGVTDRELCLYDTFTGMTEPGPKDHKDPARPQASAAETWAKWDAGSWKGASIEEVQGNLRTCNYRQDRIRLIEGDVLQTLPNTRPDQIALLRLDTDFYESTKHELDTLYKRVTTGGIIIIDDYGRWGGQRAAVDEYFDDLGEAAPMLIRTGSAERVCVKI